MLPGEDEEQSDAQLLSDDSSEVETVYESGDPVQIGMAKALLEEAKIPFISCGEGLQDLFGVGRVGGTNLLVGPARIQVSSKDAARATELLNELNTALKDADSGNLTMLPAGEGSGDTTQDAQQQSMITLVTPLACVKKVVCVLIIAIVLIVVLIMLRATVAEHPDAGRNIGNSNDVVTESFGGQTCPIERKWIPALGNVNWNMCSNYMQTNEIMLGVSEPYNQVPTWDCSNSHIEGSYSVDVFIGVEGSATTSKMLRCDVVYIWMNGVRSFQRLVPRVMYVWTNGGCRFERECRE
jgi:hypothetical protein